MMTVDSFVVFFKVLVIIAMILVVAGVGNYMKARSRHQGEFMPCSWPPPWPMAIAVSANNLVPIYLGMDSSIIR